MSSKRQLTRSEVQQFFSTRTETYNSFISKFRYPQGIRALLQSSDLLRPGLHQAFAAGGFRDVTFRRFPDQYFWLNGDSYAVEARPDPRHYNSSVRACDHPHAGIG
jgi:hypothetical protein